MINEQEILKRLRDIDAKLDRLLNKPYRGGPRLPFPYREKQIKIMDAAEFGEALQVTIENLDGSQAVIDLMPQPLEENDE